jgi:hypothetical protein
MLPGKLFIVWQVVYHRKNTENLHHATKLNGAEVLKTYALHDAHRINGGVGSAPKN